MEKLYPRSYQFDIQEVGDHLEVHISPLDITVETAPGKCTHRDAVDAAYTAIEERLLAEHEASQSVQSPHARAS